MKRHSQGWLLRFTWLAALLCAAGCHRPGIGERDEIAGMIFQEDQFFRTIELGMQDAARKHHVELFLGNSHGSLDQEIALIDTYIVRRVKAIVISPISSKGSVRALSRAHAEGIHVIAYDTNLDADFLTSYVESNQYELGQTTGKAARRYIEDRLSGKARVATLSFVSAHPESGGARLKGFVDEVTRLPGVQIVAQQDAWLPPEATNVVNDLLIAHPDLDVVWSANEGGTVGAVTAVRAVGRAGRVVVFGTDMSGQLADFLLAEDNILQAVTAQKPFEIGGIAVETALMAVHGQPVRSKVTLPGVLYSRGQPDVVKRYRQQIDALAK